MKQIHYTEGAARFGLAMEKGGAFLTVKGADGRANTMTIGWAYIGYSWRKPGLVVMVRPSRYSYAMLAETGVFTVSVPALGTLGEQLRLCGTVSGRDGDKFALAGLTAAPAQSIDCPIVAECPLHFECRVSYTQDMVPNALNEAIDASCYGQKDYHAMFFGEIVACYEG